MAGKKLRTLSVTATQDQTRKGQILLTNLLCALLLMSLILAGCGSDEVGEGPSNGNLEESDYPATRGDSAILMEPEEDDPDNEIVEGGDDEEIVPIEEVIP